MERLNDYQKAQKWLETYDWDNDPNADDNLATICEALQDMAKYKNLEEQGFLMKLPCKVGDTLYRIDTDEKIEKAEIERLTIENIVICKDREVLFKYGCYDGVICHIENIITDKPYLDFYKIFLTESEAEEELNRMKSGE